MKIYIAMKRDTALFYNDEDVVGWYGAEMTQHWWCCWWCGSWFDADDSEIERMEDALVGEEEIDI